MPDEDYEFTTASKLMQADEIVAIAKIFVSQGVNKIRLTGGEPLVRKDAAKIISELSDLPVTLALTTNAVRLHHFTELLQKKNIHLNISLDTLQRDKFLLITKRNEFDQVKNNIEAFVKLNFKIKVNVVVMKGLNENEINDFIAWTKDTPLQIRFIEFMPFAGNRWTSNKVFTLDQILETIKTKFEIIPLKNAGNDTAKNFKVKDFAGSFAVISTMSQPFCSTCNRMRLTADGKMKNCLFSKDETDLLSAYRNGEDIIPLINQSIQNKYWSLGGQVHTDFKHLQADDIKNRSMITIGG
jgi:cyclic pyranopterin phosphate synthase